MAETLAEFADLLVKTLGRIDNTIIISGPPAPELGYVGAVAIDLGSNPKAFYGPKTEAGWGEGTPFLSGADGADGEDGTDGSDGDDAWTPVFAAVADGARRVLRVTDWTGGEGAKPTTGLYLGPLGLTATLADATDVRGAAGTNGTDGDDGLDGTDGTDGSDAWSPVLANVVDGARRVQRIVDWVGGEGTKPATGVYVGPTGLTNVLADATDMRGSAGANGAGSGDMVAANNLSELTDKAAARTNLSVYSRAEIDTGLTGKADLVAGKVPVAQLPALAITDTYEVASQAAMMALSAERGDIAIRTDENKSYVLAAEPATTLANWKLLRTPTDLVLSVAGLNGAITAAALKTALAYAIADVAGLQAALDAKLALAGGVMTGRLDLVGFSERAATVASGAVAIDTGSVANLAISANTTISLTNLPASPATGQTVSAQLRITITGTPVITWPSGIKWPGGTAPTIAAGLLVVTITAYWTGSAWAYLGSGGAFS